MEPSSMDKILTLLMALLLGTAYAQVEWSRNVLHAATAIAIPSAGPIDEIVNGVNITELLAEPRQDKINSILADWVSRDVSVQNYVEESNAIVRWDKTTFRLRVVSHTVEGMRHYGAIVLPDSRRRRAR